MAITDLIFDKRPKLGMITLDCSVSETHSRSHRVSRYPVEGLADRQDHFQSEPESLELEGLISNVGPNIAGIPLDPADPLGATQRGLSAWKQLETLFESKVPFVVSTSLKTYPKMVFADGDSLTAIRDADNSEVLRFTARLTKWRVSFNTFAEAVADEAQDLAAEGSAGAAQSATEATQSTKDAATGAL
jgi:hypothetical protein